MPKLPRLSDVTYVDTSGKKRKRYSVHPIPFQGAEGFWVWDEMKNWALRRKAPGMWRYMHHTRKSARNWLKRTTVRSFKIWEVHRALGGE